MPMYVVERDMPGAGTHTEEERRAAARTSREVVGGLGTRIQWQHSYFSDDEVFCVFIAEDADPIRAHGARGDFPVTAVHRVVATTDPTTAE